MTESRAWTFVIVAGLLEMVWAIGLKYSNGFSRPVPSVVTALAMLASMWLLAQAIRVLPAGTGYAVWVGIGAVGTAILGIALLGESRQPLRLVSIAVIVAGIVGLRLAK
ncbi:MAG TPA: quaternary ammonium compound efflux SMR transporter SugE [Gemmatimonadales bacterium]|jgi:quaternary ammonium compound-resistance protein SugE